MAKLEICSKCRFERESEYGCRCSKCITSSDFTEFVPKTNADRIRSMSDEELAVTIFGSCVELMGKEECNYSVSCKQCILQWFKSKAKEES